VKDITSIFGQSHTFEIYELLYTYCISSQRN